MKKAVIFLCIVSVFLTSSCATIFTGTHRTIRFNSNPEGAVVSINGVDVGKTPCTARVKKKLSSQDVEVRLKGYNTRVFTLEKSMSKIMWLDGVCLLFWGAGLLWIAVDCATGAAADFDKLIYQIELEEK